MAEPDTSSDRIIAADTVHHGIAGSRLAARGSASTAVVHRLFPAATGHSVSTDGDR